MKRPNYIILAALAINTASGANFSRSDGLFAFNRVTPARMDIQTTPIKCA
ncbi:MAG: hypothetical protein WD688_15435 [Candidatus Binatia bacterium]